MRAADLVRWAVTAAAPFALIVGFAHAQTGSDLTVAAIEDAGREAHSAALHHGRHVGMGDAPGHNERLADAGRGQPFGGVVTATGATTLTCFLATLIWSAGTASLRTRASALTAARNRRFAASMRRW